MPWLTAFVDVEAAAHAAEQAFWRGVTGYAVSPVRGEHDEFVTMLPPAGDAHLRMQRLGDGPSRVHLDVHVPDLAEARERAVGLGAQLQAQSDGVVSLTSPAGLVFCLVHEHERVPAPPAQWGSHRSVVDQVCLDVPPAGYVAECAFWSTLLDLPLRPSSYRQFHSLERPDDVAVRILLQRRDDDTPASAHLDLACDDRGAETERHVALGAEVVRRVDGWTVLRDPAGLAYCITDRTPERGTSVTGSTRTDPPGLGTERDQLMAFLDFHRATFAMKTDGLDAAGLATTVAASTMTLGGMMKHVALNEDSWFTHRLGGGELPVPWAAVDWEARPDWEWETAADDPPEQLRAQWAESVARSRAVLADVDLDAPAAEERFNARWIVVHMIEEYARHNGHADLIREAVDGKTGE